MDNIEDWRKAGKITAQALEYGKSLIKKDASLLDVCNKIEEKIHQLGGEIAFPAQISSNETAAHFCPTDDDTIIFTDQLVCLDIGAHVNGCIGDTALSVDLSGQNTELVKASRDALNQATKILQIGTTLGEIGKVIEETIESYGFVPVRNLSGHGLDLYGIHTPPSIPNYNNKDPVKLEKGMIFAIEPFATNGNGLIHEKGAATLFSLTKKKPLRLGFVNKILKQIEGYKGLPFTKRWLTKNFSLPQVNFALNQFKQLNMLKEYPPLVEMSNALVSQAENSFLIDDKVEILTKV